MQTMEEKLCIQATEKKIPVSGAFELSPLCNMSCDMCYARMERGEVKQAGELLEGDVWIDWARQMREAGMMFLLLTGGEPLLYPDFQKVYREVCEMGMYVTLNTNGTMIEREMAEFLGKYRPRRVNISLYGIDGKGYYDLCHYPEGFDRAIRGIRLLKEREIGVKINVSLTPKNQKYFSSFYRIGEMLQVPVEVDTYMFPFSRQNQVYPQQSRLPSNQCARAYLAALQTEKPKALDQLGKICCDYKEGITLKNHQGVTCRAGRSSFWVNWQGEMSPCFAMKKGGISLRKNSFKEAWKALNQYVENVRVSSKCANCTRQEICLACPGRAEAETGDADGCPGYLCEFTEELLDCFTME
ncbi:MAG: radical SAM protein [Butyribacter sp.]|nr:radical SAM protein [Butyribacter sp.]